VPKGFSEKVKALGRIQTISEDGDLKLGKDAVFFEIKSGEDEEEIVKLSQTKRVILQCSDWTIIPLENLIAKGADVIAQVKNLDEAQTAFGILEKGVGHVLFHADDVVELKKVLSWLRSEGDKISLQTAEIVEVRPVGMGDRVCVDTCTSMGMGQGMLVGNSSSALFLIHSESISNPYVSPRPFRVNAGPVHSYTRIPGGKTRYLSELSAGDQVLIVDFKGNTSTGIVGRLKIEKRPLMLIKAVFDGQEIASIVQNAETIRLTDPEGKAVSVVSLVPGDKVLVAMEEGGRHFGIKIEESITEK
ncbi:MAG: 3-dehydroquinate synthase II, partial [Desulfobacterales bacterium]